MGWNITKATNEECSTTSRLSETVKTVEDLTKNWSGFPEEADRLINLLNCLWWHWMSILHKDHHQLNQLSNIISEIEFSIGDIARLLVESPLVKPAKSNPEDYIQLLKKIRRGVRDFVLTISRDTLDLLEDLVDGVGRDLSKVDRPKVYSLILSYEALIPSIKQGLGYYDSKNMLINTEDSARVEKLERALEALKAELEKSSLGTLKKLGMRS